MSRQEEDIHAIAGCKTIQEAFQLLQREAGRCGMQSLSWVIQLPLPIRNEKILTFHSYSKSWEERYWTQNYLQEDPTVEHGLKSLQPGIWSNMRDKNRPFWEDANAHGLVEGVAQSVWDRHGSCSMLSFSRDYRDFSDAELKEMLPRMSWLAQLAHSGMSQLILKKEIPALAADLSPREKEVLQLAATGMTSQVIANKLNLTKRTCDFHFDNAKSKLGAENRTEAVVRAIILALI